jgi:hypothetical protein
LAKTEKNIRLFILRLKRISTCIGKNCESHLLALLCLSVCLYEKPWLPLDRFLWHFILESIIKNLLKKSVLVKIDKNNTQFKQRPKYIIFYKSHAVFNSIVESILRLPWASHSLISQTEYFNSLQRLHYAYISCLVCFVEDFHGLVLCLCFPVFDWKRVLRNTD